MHLHNPQCWCVLFHRLFLTYIVRLCYLSNVRSCALCSLSFWVNFLLFYNGRWLSWPPVLWSMMIVQLLSFRCKPMMSIRRPFLPRRINDASPLSKSCYIVFFNYDIFLQFIRCTFKERFSKDEWENMPASCMCAVRASENQQNVHSIFALTFLPIDSNHSYCHRLSDTMVSSHSLNGPTHLNYLNYMSITDITNLLCDLIFKKSLVFFISIDKYD